MAENTYNVGDRVEVNINRVVQIYPLVTEEQPYAATIITYDEVEEGGETSYIYRLSVDGLGDTYTATEVNGALVVGG